jgi:nucleoid DNA-binding protein
MALTHVDLIDRLSKKFGMPKTQLRTIYDEMLIEIVDCAKAGRIELRGFGSFSVVHKPARNYRNPETGAMLLAPEKDVLRFRPAPSALR